MCVICRKPVSLQSQRWALNEAILRQNPGRDDERHHRGGALIAIVIVIATGEMHSAPSGLRQAHGRATRRWAQQDKRNSSEFRLLLSKEVAVVVKGALSQLLQLHLPRS